VARVARALDTLDVHHLSTVSDEFAEFERAMIGERMKAGLERVRGLDEDETSRALPTHTSGVQCSRNSALMLAW
jgi:hypothetical protein